MKHYDCRGRARPVSVARRQWLPWGLGLLALLVFAQPLAAQSRWAVEVVDGGGSKHVGKFTSLAIDHQGNFHLAYFDESRIALRYAYRGKTGKQWFSMEVDSEGSYVSIAVDDAGRPHFVYNSPSETGLRYAYYDGSKWHKQLLDGQRTDFFTCIQIGRDNHPKVSYYHRLFTDGSYALHLKYAAFDGQVWSTETVDQRSAVGKFNALALDTTGKPHIAYSDVDSRDLRYVSWDGQRWQYSAPDTARMSNDGWVGLGPSIVMDAQNQPHIAYFDGIHKLVKYAHLEGSAWKIEVVDHMLGKPDLDHVSLKLDSRGRAQVAYYDSGMSVLKYAIREDGAWKAEVVDNDGQVGIYPSLALDDRDRPYISYYDLANHAVRVARLMDTPVGAPATTKK